MASKVAIANRALTKLGDARILSFEDKAKGAQVIDSMYDLLLDAELRAHRWNFSKARSILPALSEAPVFGFQLQYQLPSDFLALRKIGNYEIYPKLAYGELFSIEGRRLLTNIGAPLKIIYTTRVQDPNLFDGLFVEVFASRLAVEACESITQSGGKFDRVTSMYAQSMRDAIRANAVERPSQAIADDTWLDSRK